MSCPNCGNVESKIIGSRPENETVAIYRRECSKCGMRFVTSEVMEQKGGDNLV